MALALAPLMDPAARPALDAALDRLVAALEPWRRGARVATFAEQRGGPEELHAAEVVARLRGHGRARRPPRALRRLAPHALAARTPRGTPRKAYDP
jgi:hypothetical protein